VSCGDTWNGSPYAYDVFVFRPKRRVDGKVRVAQRRAKANDATLKILLAIASYVTALAVFATVPNVMTILSLAFLYPLRRWKLYHAAQEEK